MNNDIKTVPSLPVGVPEGWKLVPVSATRDQKNSVCMHPDLAAVLYSEMVKAAPAAPTVKAEQVPVTHDLRAKLISGLDEIGALSRNLRQGGCDSSDLPGLEEGLAHAIDMAHELISLLEAPSLPAAGSAVEEVEEAASILRNMIDSIGVHGNYSQESTLLFLNQALASIVAALSAQQSTPDAPERVSVPDTARLDFMLQKSRKVVCERLPHDNFEVYVEEGFMGDVRYPAVRYSGEWQQGESYALEIQREAIDAALLASHAEGGKV